jgi:hypothetical protein
MLNNFLLLHPLVEPGVVLAKTEVIKRFRKFYNQPFFLQLLCMFPFSAMGKNEKGELFFC